MVGINKILQLAYASNVYLNFNAIFIENYGLKKNCINFNLRVRTFTNEC